MHAAGLLAAARQTCCGSGRPLTSLLSALSRHHPACPVKTGNSSIVADQIGLKLAGPEGYVVTEVGRLVGWWTQSGGNRRPQMSGSMCGLMCGSSCSAGPLIVSTLLTGCGGPTTCAAVRISCGTAVVHAAMLTAAVPPALLPAGGLWRRHRC